MDTSGFRSVPSQRQRHAAWQSHFCLAAEILWRNNTLKTSKALAIHYLDRDKTGFINLSQSIDPMGGLAYWQGIVCHDESFFSLFTMIRNSWFKVILAMFLASHPMVNSGIWSGVDSSQARSHCLQKKSYETKIFNALMSHWRSGKASFPVFPAGPDWPVLPDWERYLAYCSFVGKKNYIDLNIPTHTKTSHWNVKHSECHAWILPYIKDIEAPTPL